MKKPLQFCCTRAFHETFPPALHVEFANVVAAAFRDKPMDLYTFIQTKPGRISVRVNGYEFGLSGAKEEDYELTHLHGDLPETAWCKIDEHETTYIGTWMFPHEY